MCINKHCTNYTLYLKKTSLEQNIQFPSYRLNNLPSWSQNMTFVINDTTFTSLLFLFLSLSLPRNVHCIFFYPISTNNDTLKSLALCKSNYFDFFFVGLIKNECLFVPINCKGEPHWSYSFAFFLVITTSSWMDVQQSFCERGTVVANLFLWHLDSSDRN